MLEFGDPGMHPRRRQTPFFADRTTSNTPSVLVAVHFTKYAEHFRWNRTIYTAM